MAENKVVNVQLIGKAFQGIMAELGEEDQLAGIAHASKETIEIIQKNTDAAGNLRSYFEGLNEEESVGLYRDQEGGTYISGATLSGMVDALVASSPATQMNEPKIRQALEIAYNGADDKSPEIGQTLKPLGQTFTA